MKFRHLIIVGFLSCLSVNALAQSEKDPSPDDFLMMDKEAVLDRASLARHFHYPDSARKNALQGTVKVKVLIGKSGQAERCFVLEGVHPLLDTAACQIIMKASFTPAVYAGDNIKSWMEVPIIFKMSSARSQPVKVQGEKEGDGYQRSSFNLKQFHDSLDKSILGSLTQSTLNISIVIDAEGHFVSLKSAGLCPDRVLNELRRVLSQTTFTPAQRNGTAAEDRLTLIIDLTAK